MVSNLGSLKSQLGTGCSNTKTVCGACHWSISLTALSGVGRPLIRTRRLELKLCGQAETGSCILTCVGPQNCSSSLINNQVVDSFPDMFYFCSLCVCRQKPWKSFVIIPEMQSVLFSLEALFFVLITDIRQLPPFLKLLREKCTLAFNSQNILISNRGVCRDCYRSKCGVVAPALPLFLPFLWVA